MLGIIRIIMIRIKIALKKLLFFFITVGVSLSLIELIFICIYYFNPFSIIPWQSYSTAFDEISIPKNPSGWGIYNDSPRPSSVSERRECIAVFGDSFSHADEVNDEEAWTNLLTKSLGCKVDNFGVPGYGLDQAFIRYLNLSPKSDIVILGIYSEMLRRNFAASWLFYNQQKNVPLKPYFFMKNNEIIKAQFPLNANIDEIKKYHQLDRYYKVYEIKFPYTVSLLKTSCLRFSVDTKSMGVIVKSINGSVSRLCAFFNPVTRAEQTLFNPYENKESVELGLKIINSMREALLNKKLVFVFFPRPEELLNQTFTYQNFLQQLKSNYPDDCIIDVGPALSNADNKINQQLRAPKGHYNAIGNKLIAKEISRQLKLCKSINSQKLFHFH